MINTIDFLLISQGESIGIALGIHPQGGPESICLGALIRDASTPTWRATFAIVCVETKEPRFATVTVLALHIVLALALFVDAVTSQAASFVTETRDGLTRVWSTWLISSGIATETWFALLTKLASGVTSTVLRYLK